VPVGHIQNINQRKRQYTSRNCKRQNHIFLMRSIRHSFATNYQAYMATDWIQKVRRVSSNMGGRTSVKNPNFICSVICAYLSKNIYKSRIRRETRDNKMSKAIGGEEFLSGRRLVGNYFTASGLCGTLLLGGGG